MERKILTLVSVEDMLKEGCMEGGKYFMDILSVCKNIKKKGLRNTWKSFQKNRTKKSAEKKNGILEQRIAEMLKSQDWGNPQKEEENFQILMELLDGFSSQKKASQVLENLLSEGGDALSVKNVRSYFIKKLFPRIYEAKSQSSIR